MNFFISTVIFCTVLACSSKEPTKSNFMMFGNKILNSQDPGYNSSVAIKSKHRQFGVCSGVLIAENLVVTAAHCVKSRIIDLTDTNTVSSFIHFSKNSLETPNSHIRKIEHIEIHPEYDVDKDITLYDIAWIKFTGNIPEDYHPASVLMDLNQVRSGSNLIYTGHGMRENYQGDILLKSFGTFEIKPEVTDLMPGIMMSKVTADGVGPCSGDSGGPAFVQVDKKWYVIGVLNGSANFTACGNGYLFHNLISYFSDWIEKSSGIEIQ